MLSLGKEKERIGGIEREIEREIGKTRRLGESSMVNIGGGGERKRDIYAITFCFTVTFNGRSIK